MEGIMVLTLGMLTAIMLGINGSLANLVGNDMSVFLIHFTGLIVICLGVLLKGEKNDILRNCLYIFILQVF